MPSDLTIIKPGETYYLAKDRIADIGRGKIQHSTADTLSDPDMLSITFDIDPSVSQIKDEHISLARYMKDQFLTIDIYDADSKFLYAIAKVPMFELLRQQHPHVVRAKEIEASAPDSAEFRASIQVIMSNQGKREKQTLKTSDGSAPATTTEQQAVRTRLGQQPMQMSLNSQRKYSKVVRSHPMDIQQVSSMHVSISERRHQDPRMT